MKNKRHSDSVEQELRRYMLGELTEAEQQRYEERLLNDDQLFREVDGVAELVQDELAEDYLSGNLTRDQRRAFERCLHPSAKIQDKLLVHEALEALASRKRPGPSWMERLGLWFQPALRYAPALAACLIFLLLAGNTWSIFSIVRLENQLNEAASQQTLLTATQETLQSRLDEERQRSSRLAMELDTASSQLVGLKRSYDSIRGQELVALASFVLKPGLQRGAGETTRVSIAPGQKLVELKLDVGISEYQSYRATLYDSSNDELVVQAKLQALPTGDEVYVVLQLPTQILRAGDYQIRLSGVTASQEIEVIDRYHFLVILQ